ncbi:hypothetical protein [Natranaerovirga hydrolytica]|uniref:hypothetical protein n=1 Tax=Natranaerovirga hydrolytica TaxID=680378 RepID=UPI001402C1B6|nr:hypothetical protein [Natranaerovirga hydrolytica]
MVVGIVFTALVILWPIFMMMSQPVGEINDQLRSLGTRKSIYVLNFVLASLIAPSISFILISIAFFVPSNKDTPILSVMGVLLLVPYITLVSIAYTSQFIILQSFISSGNLIEAGYWYFGNQSSIPYFINQLGYLFFALSGLLIGYRFLFEKGIPKSVAVLLWSSGIFSILAFVGLGMKNDVLNFSTILSGMLTIPIGILVILWGMRLRSQ